VPCPKIYSFYAFAVMTDNYSAEAAGLLLLNSLQSQEVLPTVKQSEEKLPPGDLFRNIFTLHYFLI
jgi:hypothetical protein